MRRGSFTQNGLGSIFVTFLTNSSGHPAWQRSEDGDEDVAGLAERQVVDEDPAHQGEHLQMWNSI
jgi:hypothetical protein